MRLLLYWHTLRYLKWAQVAARLSGQWTKLDLAPPAVQQVRAKMASIGIDAWREHALDEYGGFTFLNETRCLPKDEGWNKVGVPKLWLYNLHYFDWLNALPACPCISSDSDSAAKWIKRWIAENPAPHGNGWEPTRCLCVSCTPSRQDKAQHKLSEHSSTGARNGDSCNKKADQCAA